MKKTPTVAESAWIADTATVRGDVTLGSDVGVWFGAVIRGDDAPVTVGDRTNVQDGSVLHVSAGNPCVIGADVTIGHRAVVHGCTVKDGALIGMGSIVLDNAVVGQNAFVAAGALVPPGMEIPAGMMAMGVPARIKGPVKEEHLTAQKARIGHYVERKQEYRTGQY